MRNFKKNRPVPNISLQGVSIIENAEDGKKKINLPIKKEITIPFSEDMSGLLEKLFHYYEGDISRRKLCARYLLRTLKDEVKKLNLD